MKYFIVFLFLFVVTAPVFVSAAINLNLSYPEFGNVTFDKSECEAIAKDLKEGRTPPKICGQQLGGLIAWLYYFIIGIAGLAAFVMLVWGGIQWLTSGAIPSQAGEAKDKLKSAILGLLLILASFLIIQIINPQLTILNQPGLGELVGIVPTLPEQGSGGAPIGTNTVALSANGQPGLLVVPPVAGVANITLEWTVSGPSTCNADSIPDPALWTGSKSNSGTFTEPLTVPVGLHTFILACGVTTDDVQVSVTSAPPGVPITVDLKARDSGAIAGGGIDGPITFDTTDPANNDIPSGKIALDWTSSASTASCDTSGAITNEFLGIARPANGSWTSNPLIGPLPGTYTYSITCIDISGTQTDTDTVDLIVI